MNLTDNEIKKRKVKKYFDDEGRKKFAHKTDIQKEMEIKKPLTFLPFGDKGHWKYSFTCCVAAA